MIETLSPANQQTRYGSQDYTSQGALTKDEQEVARRPVQADPVSPIETQITTQPVNQGIDRSVVTELDDQRAEILGFQIDAFTQQARQQQTENADGAEHPPSSIDEHRGAINDQTSAEHSHGDDDVHGQDTTVDQENSKRPETESPHDPSSPDEPNHGRVEENRTANNAIHNLTNSGQING